MNRKDYVASFLKPGQKRLPRKLKKMYLKKYIGENCVIIQNYAQFSNIFKDAIASNNSIYNAMSKEYLKI